MREHPMSWRKLNEVLHTLNEIEVLELLGGGAGGMAAEDRAAASARAILHPAYEAGTGGNKKPRRLTGVQQQQQQQGRSWQRIPAHQYTKNNFNTKINDNFAYLS